MRVDDVRVLAVDRDDQVPREREHRQRVLLRVGADEHDRVAARVRFAERIDTGSCVVADHQRRRRVRRRGDGVELLRRELDRLRVRRERVERLVRIEVEPAGDAARDDEQAEGDPAEDEADEAPCRPPRRRRLPVSPHRLEDARR